MLSSIAARIRFLLAQTAELDPELLALVKQHAAGPTLLAEPGVGPVVAAQLLISWSHRGRVRNEAAFAALAGAAPLEASSGQRTRHRLNRGGDRDLNRALHVIAITRLRCHAESRAYETKRTAQGKTRQTSAAPSNAHSPAGSTDAFKRRHDRPKQSRPMPQQPLTNIGASNGLLRQYFPKGTDLSRWSAEDLEAVALALNNRPRKSLDWKTPAEVFEQQLRSLKQPGVATTG